MCHFYGEIVKFGLILTHLKLFRGQTGGARQHFEGKMPPMPPCGAATANYAI